MESAAGKPETKPHTVTKADLVEEVIHATELGRKESEEVVEIIFENITQALQKSDKIEIRGFGAALGEIPRPASAWKSPPRKSLTSSRARN
jgi:hypothetical protein